MQHYTSAVLLFLRAIARLFLISDDCHIFVMFLPYGVWNARSECGVSGSFGLTVCIDSWFILISRKFEGMGDIDDECEHAARKSFNNP